MLVAAIAFVALEIAALWAFVRRGFSLFTVAGIALAVLLLFASLSSSYLIWVDLL